MVEINIILILIFLTVTYSLIDCMYVFLIIMFFFCVYGQMSEINNNKYYYCTNVTLCYLDVGTQDKDSEYI